MFLEHDEGGVEVLAQGGGAHGLDPLPHPPVLLLRVLQELIVLLRRLQPLLPFVALRLHSAILSALIRTSSSVMCKLSALIRTSSSVTVQTVSAD